MWDVAVGVCWEVAGGWVEGEVWGEMFGTLWILSMEIKRKLRSDEIEVGNIRSMEFLNVDSVVIAGESAAWTAIRRGFTAAWGAFMEFLGETARHHHKISHGT